MVMDHYAGSRSVWTIERVLMGYGPLERVVMGYEPLSRVVWVMYYYEGCDGL